MDKQQQRKKEDDKKKLQKLLKKYQNWLEEQKKFIDIACTLRGPPNVILCSPQKLRATWSPPLRDGRERYSYDIKVKAVDSAGITHELINRSQCNNSIEFDDDRIATATMIHVAVRSTLSIPISMLCREKTASSEETHTLVGEWSEATLMNSTSKPTVMPESRELKPPEKVTIAYDKCRKSITGDIFLTKAADFSVIIVQLLDCENVISTQPTLLSPLKTKGPEKMITYAFNANNVSHSDASGPFSVQAQVWVWDNSGEDYIKSDFTRSENHIARAQQPEWIALQYKISEDVVEARIKSSESPCQCSVNFMEGTSIKEESKVFSVPVTSHEDGNGNWCFTADGAYFRNCLNPGSDKLTGLALVEGKMNRLESRPVFSWPKESPVFLLPPPSSLKCEYFPAKSITSTSRGCIQLKWNSHEEDCSFQVGLTEVETSQLLYSECAEMNSQGITIDVYSLSTTLPPFKCFVQSLGDIKHINSEQVMSDTVFYPLSKPSILIAEFDYSTSTLMVAFKGDKRASHFLLLCMLAYHPSILITKTKIVEQNYNSTEDLQECSMCFEEGTILGCVSIDVLAQAVGGGSYISSCCQTCVSFEPIPSPNWISVVPHYQEDWTVNKLDVIWPKQFTLRQQCGLICAESSTVVWSMTSHDSHATINLPSAVDQSKSSLQLQVYVKNIGDGDVFSDSKIDTTVYCSCLVSEMKGVFVVFTGVSLQRVMTLYIGNSLAQRCLALKMRLNMLVVSESPFSSPVRIVFGEQPDSEPALEMQNIQKYGRDLDRNLERLHKKNLKWLRQLKEDTSTKLILEELREKQVRSAGEWERILTERSEAIHYLERNWIISTGVGMTELSESLRDEVEKLLKLAKLAEADIGHWKCSKTYLDDLKEHMEFNKSLDSEMSLRGYRNEFLERKKTLKQNILCLSELETFSDDCSSSGDMIKKCESAVEKCTRGIENYESRINTIKEDMNKAEIEQKRVLNEIIKCEVQLNTFTTCLQKKYDRLQQKMNEMLEELNSDAYIARFAAAHAERSVQAIGGGSFLGTLAVIGIGVATGGLGLAAGAYTAATVGGIAYAAAKTDQNTKIMGLRRCQDEIKRCDNILMECNVEIGHMRDTIERFEINSEEMDVNY